MGTYHEAAYTLEPETSIPDPAAPAIGVNATGQAAAISDESEAYAASSKIAVTVTENGVRYATVTLTPATALPAGTRLDWKWGDGAYDTDAVDLVQGHQYAVNGAYDITALIREPGLPSFDLSLRAVIDGTIDV